jgi:hypothetical protein
MTPIEEMLAEADRANSQSCRRWEDGLCRRHEFMVAEEFKPLREQWYLGHFIRVYNETADIQLRYAERVPEAPKPTPDFAVYEASGSLHSYIELTEWLEPNRKRDEEYSQPFNDGATLVGGLSGLDQPDPRPRLREQLLTKSKKKYPPRTWLLIDDNVGSGGYRWADEAFGDVEGARAVVNELKDKLTDISQVWLLRETARPMTVHRLFPDRESR